MGCEEKMVMGVRMCSVPGASVANTFALFIRVRILNCDREKSRSEYR
jgi:hypothetical protein